MGGRGRDRGLNAVLLIDGYNLLHASGVLAPRGRGTALARAREALLDRLLRLVSPDTLARTIVVFDGRDAPPGLPRSLRHGEIRVRFAARDREADELIEELIEQNTAPGRLTVVSSDHRVQRAARRRNATAVDSGAWFASQQRDAETRASNGGQKPTETLTEEEVQRWLDEFGR